jgi:UDP-N-acetylglucosamine:LPS N-acetylglucosamine transferase
VVGERFLGEAAHPIEGADGIVYQVIGYEEHMDHVYAAADVLLTRAGASTVAELATVGAPAIVVPWSGAAEDHQTANARVLGDAGGAIVVSESDLTVDTLESHIQSLRDEPGQLAELAGRARMLGEPHRSGKLVDVITEAAHPGAQDLAR